MKLNSFSNNKIVLAGCLLIAVCGLLLFIFVIKKQTSSTAANKVNELLHNETNLTTAPRDLTALGKNLEDYLNKNVPGSSVYVEALDNASSFMAGPHSPHMTMSLMKVPIIMNLYKAVELNRLEIDEVQTVKQEQINKDYGNSWRQGVGSEVTLGTAAELALRYSDNTAINVVNDRVNGVLLPEERAVGALDLEMYSDARSTVTYMTAANYATVFRCLYYACYLTPADSQRILSLLTETEFQAPASLLPKGVVIAHKIGSAGQHGYSDCGIVYYPSAPYSQCIMLNESEPDASRHISNISKIIYSFFSTVH